jgi:hypothetical protein
MTIRAKRWVIVAACISLAGCAGNDGSSAGGGDSVQSAIGSQQTSSSTPQPWLTPTTLPGRLEAENYSAGGEHVGYVDTTPGNAGGQYRTDDVDIQATTDTGGGYDVGWIVGGEWLSYAVNVTTAGQYTVTARMAANTTAAAQMHLELDDRVLDGGTFTFTGGSGWQAWKNVTATVNLPSGAHTLVIAMDSSSFNLNYVNFALAATCPTGFATQVFRDDFNGTSLDTSTWGITTGAADPSAGSFTQITSMISENVAVSDGLLRLTTKRTCSDAYTDPTAAAHPASCSSGKNYYSGAWIKANWTAAMLAPKGIMMFAAQPPTPQPGTWPALWARNTDAHGYGEFDLIEQWFDSPAGTVTNVGDFSATTHFGPESSPTIQTTSNQVGPFSGLDDAFHIWAVAWDSTVVPSTVKYYYGASPGDGLTLSDLTLLRTVTYQSAGLSSFSSADFTAALDDSWRPYIDVGVSPANSYHESPDSAPTFNTAELDVDWVLMCKP